MLRMTQLGSFPNGVLWLAPEPSDALSELQHDVVTTLQEASWPPAFAQRSDPSRWAAHCTLATRVPRAALARLLHGPFPPFPATLDALAVILVGGRGDGAHLPLRAG